MKNAESRPPLSPRRHVTELIKWMSTDVYEKDHIIAMALLCAVAGENIFLLGPPGTAKSMVAARLKDVFSHARSFDYLMSRFSTPDEIFGPVSISRLKNNDRYERLTDGYLPEAHVVFLDEIWKAGPSIQNTLLTAINEHTFYNGGVAVKIPMKVLIAASNELPARDEGLEALWDRFMMRMISNCIDSERDFFKMLLSPRLSPAPPAENLLITDELYADWQRQALTVTLTDEVRQAISYVRTRLNKLEADDGNKLRFYISDRRWRKAYGILQTSAFLNDRQSIDLSDFFLLVHSFWNDIDAIPAVVETFAESLTAWLRNEIHELEVNIRRSMKAETPARVTIRPAASTSERHGPKIYDYFYYCLAGHPAGEVYFSKYDYSTLTDNPRQGVMYLDTARRRTMVRAFLPGGQFDAKAQNATDVRQVNLRHSPTGIFIDSVHYPFVVDDDGSIPAPATDKSPKKSASLKNMPVYQRVDAMEKMLADLTRRWNDSVKSTWQSEPNLFLPRADRAVIDKALKEADSLLRTVEVKLKNLRSML
ncbi:MAG: AAA domain-containing protein [Bacteroides sp.]|nr:AAA domain-containing protein [Bacteroides sp.]